MSEAVKEAIRTGKTALGIEFGSTRIKAVLVDESHAPIAMGTYDWENRLENNIWTYSLEDIWKGLQTSYQELAKDVKEQYGETLTKIGSMDHPGLSGIQRNDARLYAVQCSRRTSGAFPYLEKYHDGRSLQEADPGI